MRKGEGKMARNAGSGARKKERSWERTAVVQEKSGFGKQYIFKQLSQKGRYESNRHDGWQAVCGGRKSAQHANVHSMWGGKDDGQKGGRG